MEPDRESLPPPPQVIRLKSYTINPAIPELICQETDQSFPVEQLEMTQPPLTHTNSLPMYSSQAKMRTAMPMISTNIKPQELPEFRLRHANIETTSTGEEYDDFTDATSSPERVDKGYGISKFKMNNGPLKSIINPFAQEYAAAAQVILRLMEMRDKYIFEHCQYSSIEDLIEEKPETKEPVVNYLKADKRLPHLKEAFYKTENGVIIPYIGEKPIYTPITMDQYIEDLTHLIVEGHNSANKSYCYKRLNILEEKFKMHLLLNQEKELLEQKCNQERDFYNVRKVDTHIHHSACMNVTMLLEFIKQKVKEEPERAVILDPKTGKTITLLEVFQRHHLNPQAINVGVLDMQAGLETFHRFDRFNKKYNPFSQTDFREIFLKTDNLIGGEYLAEITKQVFHNYAVSKYQYGELRISIYGKSPKEWDKLAEWFDRHEVYHHQVRWLIQIPRIYEVYRKAGVVENFQQMIDNIFKVLFDVTINPEHNPKLYKLLFQIVGFDSVDDESLYEKSAHSVSFKISPADWNYLENPHYCYWAYYLWANISTLNHLRKARGLNSFSFRPHCGEAGSPEHLMAAFLLADGINHGIKLEKAPVLEYLFYLKQIGVAMSPLSNNKLFLRYQENPLPRFFARGLNVSLSTDDPLIFHMTNEPLMEEYSIAAQVYAFSACDVCEIARNSVLQSGFEEVVKKYWLGNSCKLETIKGANCFEMSNIPNTRFQYRQDTLDSELQELHKVSKTEVQS